MGKLKVIGEAGEEVPDLFSYAALSREDEAAARSDAALIKAHMRSAAESIVEVGLALKRQKERLPHGMFLPWIAAEFAMSERRAQEMMNVAKVYADKSAVPAGLGAEVLYALAAPSTTPEVRDEVEALVIDGQKVTAADVKRLKAEAKTAQDNAAALSERNLELTVANQAKKAGGKKPPEVDLEAIRAEARAAVEAELRGRINQLSDANVAAQAELKRLRGELEQAETASRPQCNRSAYATLPSASRTACGAFTIALM